jgi:translation initiation factor IF-1
MLCACKRVIKGKMSGSLANHVRLEATDLIEVEFAEIALSV